MSHSDISTKIKWAMLLHALGDTLGFYNGEWEFNHYIFEKRLTLDYVNELIYEFIELGGVNGIDLKGWHVSDDTIFHLAIANSMLKYDGKLTDKFILSVKHKMASALAQIKRDLANKDPLKQIDRKVGEMTTKSIMKFEEDVDARNDGYTADAGGNGAAMRSIVIGLCLHGKDRRSELIDCSVTLSMLTHNNPIGYLGGFSTALFAAFALEKIPLHKWPFMIIEELATPKLKSFMSSQNLDEAWDYSMFVKAWKKYTDTRFVNGKPIKNKAFSNPMYRIRYYHDNFFKDTKSLQIGDSGYLCVIMAYDALLDCDGKWEKIIVYSMLHSGDSDTIGAVAGGLYGAVYGKGDVPQKMLENLEFSDDIIKLSKMLAKKYATKRT